jgi:YD repeat-containing protein
MKKCISKGLTAVLFLVLVLLVFPASSFAESQSVFGPKDFRIGQMHFHLSVHSLSVDSRGEGLIVVTKKTPEKRMEGGFVLLNGQVIGLHDFLEGKNQSTERKVSLRLRNLLTVFLRGVPGATISIEVKKGAVTPPPQVTFQAAPQTITIGETSTLQWTSTYADRITIDQGIGDVAASGSLGVSPKDTTTYTLTATGKGGTATGSATVRVTVPTPTVSVSVNPDTIVQGSSSTLTWSSTFADTVNIEPGIGTVSTSGSLTVSPAQTTTYMITATGRGGTTNASAALTVLPPPTVTLGASPQSVLVGGFSTLTWTSTNAESCAIEPGIGSVDVNGSLHVTPAATTIYVITATGPSGTAMDSVEVQVVPAFEYESYGVEADEQEGGCGLIAESIRILNGNLVEVRSDLDFPSPNHLGFRLLAVYNSRYENLGFMGYGWTHSYEVSLDPAFVIEGVPSVRIIDGTAKTFYFREEVPGEYSGLFGEHSRVKAEADGYVWYRLDGSVYSFSSTGRLIRMADAAGNSIDLTHDLNNRLERVTDTASGRALTFHYNGDRLHQVSGPVTAAVPNGVWVTYGYDGNQNLTTVTYADGSTFAYIYNDANDIHNLTQKKDLPNHMLREWSYNTNDQAVACLTPDGKGATSITYGDPQVEVRDVYDVLRIYTLAKIDGRKKATLMNGIPNAPYTKSNAVRWAYDERARLTEVEYGGGRIDLYQDYDDRGNAATVLLASGSADQRIIQYTYHPKMNMPLTRTESSVLQGSGNKVTVWDYDNDYDTVPNESPTSLVSRLIEQGHTADLNGTVVPYEYVTTFTYNDKRQVRSVDGPRPGTGDTTTFAYNASTGNLESFTQPHIGSTHFTEYDSAGRPGRTTDVNNQARGFSYDGRGRVTTITNYADDPPSSTQFAYVGGLLDSVTDPDGVIQFIDYDALYGRLSAITDAEGNYIAHTYETYPRGNLIERSKYSTSQTRTSRQRWSYEHPNYPGKLFREIQADDTYREYGYDAAANVSPEVDPNGNATSYTYDFLNRLESVAQTVSDPTLHNLTTMYDYDSQGNLKRVTDALSHYTDYQYDDMGRVVSATSPDTGITRYTYDEAGNLTHKTDAKGVTVEFTFDDLNRVTAADYPGTADDIAYAYDQGTGGNGHLTGMVDPAGTIAFGYDATGRLVQKTSTINGVNYPVTYVYTPGGKVASVTYPSGRTISYVRNPLGKISEVTASGIATPLASGLTYRPFGGPLGLTNGFGGTVNNQAGECDCVTVSNPGQPRERSYEYDANRNLTSITGTATPWYSQSFGYDELNRLSSATGRYGSITYTYDDVGNRLTSNTNGVKETYTYVTGTNRINQITG